MADAPPPPGGQRGPGAGQSEGNQPPAAPTATGYTEEEREGGELHIIDVLGPEAQTGQEQEVNQPQIVAVEGSAPAHAQVHAQIGESSTVKVEYSATATGPTGTSGHLAQEPFAGVGLRMIRPGHYQNPNLMARRASTLDMPTPASFLPGGQYYDPAEYARQQQLQQMQAMQAMSAGFMPMFYPPMMQGPMTSMAAVPTSQFQATHSLPALPPQQPRSTTVASAVPPVAVVTATAIRPAAPAIVQTTATAGTSGARPAAATTTTAAQAATVRPTTSAVDAPGTETTTAATGLAAIPATTAPTAASGVRMTARERTATTTTTATKAATTAATAKTTAATGTTTAPTATTTEATATTTAPTATTTAVTTTTTTGTAPTAATGPSTSGVGAAKQAKSKTAGTSMPPPHRIPLTRSAAAAAAKADAGKKKTERQKLSAEFGDDEGEDLDKEEQREEGAEEEDEDEESPLDDDVADPNFEAPPAHESPSSGEGDSNEDPAHDLDIDPGEGTSGMAADDRSQSLNDPEVNI